MVALASIALPALILGSVASAINFDLRVRVPVICSIESLSASTDNPRVLRVSTSCNAENIDLSFDGDLGDNRVSKVNSAHFASSHGASSVMLRQFRPGRSEVEIVFEKDIETLSSNSVSLVGY
ncbi:hypothetical protein [Erythrobacter litoralis]|uniref:hypothetical protein n=1 Tax=Erythrobacter litoralis TaxID=39960 RepID=UPI0012379B29|nr:hypothetical protein [Erythrobacter litoralis]